MMKPKPASPRPTESELAILRVLWERGPSTVREVHAALHAGEGKGYTTTLKLMQIMAEKGLLDRDVSERSHIYRPRTPREKMQGQLVGDLMERAFGGSASGLILQALSSQRSTPEELAEIRRMLDEAESNKRPGPESRE